MNSYYNFQMMNNNNNPTQQANISKMRANIANWRNSSQKRKQLHHYTIKKHKMLLERLSYRDPQNAEVKRYNYSSDTLIPYVYFYKLLAHKPNQFVMPSANRLLLNIPDTIVYNDGDLPTMWFFTDQQGYVCRVDNVPAKQVSAKLTQRAHDSQLVAVLKKPYYSSEGLQGNQIKLIGCKQLRETIIAIATTKGQINALQKFVKGSSIKPFIVRTAWKKNKIPQCWVITSNYEYNSEANVPQLQKLTVVPKIRGATTAIQSNTGRFLAQTIIYINNIRKYLQLNLDIEFEEFVGDFIKDEGQNWWYINTKAFVLKLEIEKVFIKKITYYGQFEQPIRKVSSKKKVENYQKCRNCKYCNKIYPDHLMTHKLTLIMLLQADKHLLSRGKQFPWLQRCFNLHIGNVNLYIEHKVCDSCYKLYKQIEKLMQLEIQFATMIGITVMQDNKNNVSITALPAFKGHSPQFGSRLQKNTYEQKMPQNWGFPINSQINVQDLTTLTSQMIKKYRLMVLIHSVRDIPMEKLDKNYYLQYTFFETKIKYRLEMEKYQYLQNGFYKVNINKIRIFYFFILERKHLNTFIKQTQSIKINLLEDERKIGELELELSDFLSQKVIKREFYKMFSGKEIIPILSWGLHTTLGIHQSSEIQISNLKVHESHGLYLPDNIDYFNCDPLPQQWVNVISQKQQIQIKKQMNETHVIELFQQTPEKQIEYKAQQQADLTKEIAKYEKRRGYSQKSKRRIYY